MVFLTTEDRVEHERNFNVSNFKRDVFSHYEIPDGGHCHVIGRIHTKFLKTAYLVPKGLRGDGIAHLSGVKALVSSDPRNGEFVLPMIMVLALTYYSALVLHERVEEALDSGRIVIMPILKDQDIKTGSRWKCVLVHAAMRHTTVETYYPSTTESAVHIIWDVS
jgi:hypothetical protein